MRILLIYESAFNQPVTQQFYIDPPDAGYDVALELQDMRKRYSLS